MNTNNLSLVPNRDRVSVFSVLVAMAILVNPFSTFSIGGTGIFVFVFVPILIIFLYYCISKSKPLKWDSSLKTLLFLFLFNFLGFLWSPVFSAIGLAQVAILVFSISFVQFNGKEKELIKIVAVLSLIAGCYLVYISSIGILEDGRASIIVFGVERDPNYVALTFLPGVAVISQVLLSSKSRFIWKILSGVFLLVVLYTTLSMGTRSGTLTCLVIIALSFLCYRKASIGNLIFAVVLFLVFYLFLPYAINLLPDNVAVRYSEEVLENDGLGNRQYIWIDYLNNISANNSILYFLFGRGTNSSLFIMKAGTHNFILQYFYEGGVVAIVLISMFIIRFVRIALKSKNFLSFVVFTSTFFMGLSLGISGMTEFWLNIAIAYALISSNQQLPDTNAKYLSTK